MRYWGHEKGPFPTGISISIEQGRQKRTIVLRRKDISQTQKEKYYIIPYVESKEVRFVEAENRTVVTRVEGMRRWSGYKVTIIWKK